jgi:stress-induced morphogen
VIEPSVLEERLLAAFPDAEVEIEDLTGTKDHYRAQIRSQAFSGKTLIEQHQLVYRALAEEMKGPIHALTLKTSPRA